MVFEMALWPAAALCIGVYAFLQWQHYAHAQGAVEDFYAEIEGDFSEETFPAAVESALEIVDGGLWSNSRMESIESTQRSPNDVLAVIKIPRLFLEAPVFEGAQESELDRGPGWIRGTAQIGGLGNVGIAGHRDGFFRALKDIEPGDTIEIVGRDTVTRYKVADTWVVDPDAVHVLDATKVPAITLVTCYPFYFVGHAPQRFIVRAERVDAV